MRVRTRTWFSFVVAVSVLFIIASQFSIFDPLDSAVLVVAQPIESGLRDATQPLADLVNNVTAHVGLTFFLPFDFEYHLPR